MDYKEKANHFNKFFASQCTPIDNDSQIIDSLVFNTEARFSSITCENNDILKIIRNLGIRKAHGFDDISIRMVTLCDDSLVKPLSIIFQKCINSDVFPDSWKKSNIVSVHKEIEKQLINNYRPVSLLPICSKIFERIIFNSIFQFIEESKLLNVNQSGFQPGDSCEYQLLLIVQIYMLVLTKTLHLKCFHVFFTSERLLIRFGMRSLFIR